MVGLGTQKNDWQAKKNNIRKIIVTEEKPPNKTHLKTKQKATLKIVSSSFKEKPFMVRKRANSNLVSEKHNDAVR